MNHTLNHYVIGAVAVILGAAGIGLSQTKDVKPVLQLAHVDRVTKHVWPSLTDAQQAALTAALAPSKGRRALVFCDNPNCRDLAEDITDALRAAGLTATIEISMFPINPGFNVSGRPDDAKPFEAAGLHPRFGEPAKDLLISIGEKP